MTDHVNYVRVRRDVPYEDRMRPVLAKVFHKDFTDVHSARLDLPFTKSRGTIMFRLYERLTKASRRREPTHYMGGTTGHLVEAAYRRGTYDAYTALQDEMA